MAQTRHRPTVTLTLDPDVLDAARQLLRELPGKLSLSGVVDDVLREWVNAVAPLVARLKDADPVERVRILHEVYGRQMAMLGREFDATVRAASEDQEGD